MALRVRKHMVPHVGDGLPTLDDTDNKGKLLIRALVGNLPRITPHTPHELLDGLTKCNCFVIIAVCGHRADNGFQDPLPILNNSQGEVFWIAGQSDVDENYFVVKSQDALLEAGSSEWGESKWERLHEEICSVALLDMKRGGWVVRKAEV